VESRSEGRPRPGPNAGGSLPRGDPHRGGGHRQVRARQAGRGGDLQQAGREPRRGLL